MPGERLASSGQGDRVDTVSRGPREICEGRRKVVTTVDSRVDAAGSIAGGVAMLPRFDALDPMLVAGGCATGRARV
jgi:hypothetical protein